MPHPSIRPWAGALAALGLLLASQRALALTATAQQPLPGMQREAAPLQGIVVHESTGQPIESATVTVLGTDIETQTGRYGDFAFPDLHFGLMSVRVTAPGHPSVTQAVDVTDDGIVFLQFRLPSVSAVLSELLVGVSRDEPMASLLTAADLLAIEVPSARVRSGNVGKTDYAIRLRESATSFTQSVEPLVYVDGVMISGLGQAFEALSQISASDVEDIKVLRGPAAAFLYPMAANGVVLVKTRSGRHGR